MTISALRVTAVVLLFAGSCLLVGKATASPYVAAPDTIYAVVDEPPEPVDGLAAMMSTVRFPASMVDGPAARLILQFVVDETGAARDIEVLRDGPEAYRAEAERVISATRFVPGRRSGEPVASLMVLPFRFVPPERAERVVVIPPTPVRASAPPRPAPSDDEVPEVVETPPVLIGGLEGLYQRLRYPELARRMGTEGTVIVSFIVERDGSISDIECLRDPMEMLCGAAIQAVLQSRFQPGTQEGRPARVRFSLPLRFRLR